MNKKKVHLFQLLLHGFFQVAQVISFMGPKTNFEILATQFVYLTNLSNWNLLIVIGYQVYYDFKNKSYPWWLHLYFQVVRSAVTIVFLFFWILTLSSSQLLLDFEPTNCQLADNVKNQSMKSQIEPFISKNIRIPWKQKLIWITLYYLQYFIYYYIYYMETGKHAYGFQNLFNLIESIIFYIILLSSFIIVDLLYSYILEDKQKQIINNKNTNNIANIKNKNKMINKENIHKFQLLIQGFFQLCQIDAFRYDKSLFIVFLQQFSYLTNLTNWGLFLVFLFFIYYDRKKQAYPYWLNAYFQVMRSATTIVMIYYHALVYAGLLFSQGFVPSLYQWIILFYTHSVNWLIIQGEPYLWKNIYIETKQKIPYYVFYIILYFAIYGIYYLVTGQHIYPFQAYFNVIQTIIFYAGVTLFIICLQAHNCVTKLTQYNILSKRRLIEN
ncbi:hypothetical protein pb186bvf_011096 [Paramecium bursaria]